MMNGRALAVIAALVCAPKLWGQTAVDSIHHRNNCRLAVQVVTRGTPSPHTDWAFATIGRCGSDGATALASVLSAHRSVRDTLVLSRAFAPTRTLRDSRLYAQVKEIAADADASEQARVFAIRSLIWALNPGLLLSYTDIAGDAEGRAHCAGSFTSNVVLSVVTRFPPDYEAEIHHLATELALNVAVVPRPVRTAANCARLIRRTPWLDDWEADP